jgi:hypothetical protein
MATVKYQVTRDRFVEMGADFDVTTPQPYTSKSTERHSAFCKSVIAPGQILVDLDPTLTQIGRRVEYCINGKEML